MPSDIHQWTAEIGPAKPKIPWFVIMGVGVGVGIPLSIIAMDRIGKR